MSVYARLGFNSANPTINALSENYTTNVNTQMTILPSLLRPWQVNALASNTVSNFFVNPVANITQEIWNTSNTLVSLTNGLFADPPNASVNVAVANVYSTSTILSSNTANSYLYITNKQSNVIPPDSDYTTNVSTANAQALQNVVSTINFVMTYYPCLLYTSDAADE